VSAGGHVLIVDDESNVRKVLGALLEQAGYTTTPAASAEEALDLVRSQDPDVVISDLKMPGQDGLDLLSRLKAGFPEIPVVLLTAHGTVETAVEAMKRGALDFLTKPFDKAKVLEIVAKACAQGGRSREEFQGPLVDAARCGMIGRSEPMQALFRTLEKIAPSPSTVLITGETGTGKELVAEALHRLSPRSAGPLVKINAGALPENLVEAELFGHERGAFSGADRPKPGRFELADQGTLFLDEISEMPLASQVKLLRVLQDGAIDRLGGSGPRRIDVRLVAATNKDLAERTETGRFREDLLYRLKVIEIRVPPLRERLDDIPLLVDFFLDKHSRRLARPRPSVTPEAVDRLAAGSWPGNVRELENAIERALLLSDSGVLDERDFSAPAGLDANPPKGIKEASRRASQSAQVRLIRDALQRTGGNVSRAADLLGMSRRGLQLRMKALGLRKDLRTT